jgi:methionyl-tRNA formyltransferase
MLKVALLAPIHNSLYARLVVHQLLDMDGVELCAIIVRRHWNLKRFRSEFGRDGARLLRKINRKFVQGDARFESSKEESLMTLARELAVKEGSLKDIAARHHIAYLIVSDLNRPESVELLRKTAPQVIAFTGGGLIRKSVLDIPEIGILNCHTGILPQYRGMDVVEWTAAEENIEVVGFGATLHLMDKGVDTGPILLKHTISPKPGENFRVIRQRLEVLMVRLMVEGIRGLRDGKLTPQPQKEADGRQYFVMHSRVKQYAQRLLDDHNSD